MGRYGYLFSFVTIILVGIELALSTSQASFVVGGIATWIALQPVIVALAKGAQPRAFKVGEATDFQALAIAH